MHGLTMAPCSGPSSSTSRNVLNDTNASPFGAPPGDEEEEEAAGTGVARGGSKTVFICGCDAPALGDGSDQMTEIT